MKFKKMFDALIYFIKSKFLIATHNFAECENLTFRYIKKYPKEPFYYLNLAKINILQGKNHAAIDQYQILMKLRKPTVADYVDLIPILYQERRYSEVINTAEDFFKFNFSHTEQYFKKILSDRVYWYLAYAYYHEKQYSNALLSFNKLLSLKIKNEAEFYPPIAECYLMLGDFANSVKYCNLALSENLSVGHKPLIFRTLGYNFQKMGKVKEAINSYDTALSLDNSLIEVHYNLSVIYDSLGEYDKAIQHLIIARERYDDSKSFLELGRLYEKKGDLKLALENYKKALDLEPENSEIQEVIHRINHKP